MTGPGISALETLLPLTLALVHEGVLTPLAATARLTLGPARIAGLDAGTITVGSAADLVLLDPRHPWTLRAEPLRSAGHHTPFAGHGFKGCATTTLQRRSERRSGGEVCVSTCRSRWTPKHSQ